MKNVLWSNIGKVHDVTSAIPRLTAHLTLQKNLLHELNWKKRKKAQQSRIPMKIDKIFYKIISIVSTKFCNIILYIYNIILRNCKC